MGKGSGDGDTNINYGQQGVGINRGIVHFHAPQPAVTAEPLAENEKTDEGYLTKVAIHLEQAYAAQNLAVLLGKGSQAERFEVCLAQSGIMSITSFTTDDGREARVLQAPLASDYVAEVVTKKRARGLDLQAHLDVQVQGVG